MARKKKTPGVEPLDPIPSDGEAARAEAAEGQGPGPSTADTPGADAPPAGPGTGAQPRRLRLAKSGAKIGKKYERRMGRRLLKPEELPELHQAIGDGYAAKMRIMEELKAKAEEIKEIKGRLNETTKRVEEDLSFMATGKRPEERRCLVTKNFQTGRCVVTDAETGEVYVEREIMMWERQRGMYEHDCQDCKYCGCAPAAIVNAVKGTAACPESFEDCSDCPEFTCALLPARCDHHIESLPESVSASEAETLDCFFCNVSRCAGDKKACGRQSDCHGCPSFSCVADKRRVKDGYCVLTGKAVVVVVESEEKAAADEADEDDDDDDICFYCSQQRCALDESEEQDNCEQDHPPDCRPCPHFICETPGECPQHKGPPPAGAAGADTPPDGMGSGPQAR